MARILGVEESEANMFTRFAYGMVRRKVGKVIMPMKVHAQHLKLFGGMAAMEMAQDKAHDVDTVVKSLVQIRAATLIGCPF